MELLHDALTVVALAFLVFCQWNTSRTLQAHQKHLKAHNEVFELHEQVSDAQHQLLMQHDKVLRVSAGSLPREES